MNAGDLCGPYRLVAELGSGGMGTVYAADGPTGRVALKVIHPHLAATPEFAQRFRREGELGLRVRHENVVATLAVGSAEVNGRAAHYLVMEFVAGRTLRALLAELGRVPEQLCRHVGRAIAEGLAAIHAAGAVHRDLKPDNVLVTADNVVKVMDLGVARETGDATRLSQPGAFVGSFHYAAPEQLAAGDGHARDTVDHRADLHALGLVLYEMAAGRNPYDEGDVARTIGRILRERPRRLSETNPQITVFFEEFVATLLEKDPAKRFATAEIAARVLEEGEDSLWWHRRATSIRRLTGRALRRVRVRRETALYGRDDELAALAAHWELAKAGEGQVVLLGGEDGIGKSRLVDEFASRRQEAGDDFHFLVGAFPPPAVASSSGAFAAAFREHLGADALADALPPLLASTPLLVPAFAAHLAGDAVPAGAEPLTRESLQTLYVNLLRAIAGDRPMLFFVDDLDFAPSDGRALFTALALAVAGHRVMLVGAVRPGANDGLYAELDRRGAVARIGLSRLGPKDLSRLLVDAFRSERLAEELGFQIAAKSDGNPFFVFEILRGLREGRFIEKKGDGTWASTQAIREIKVPSSVQELVASRLAALTIDERNVLDVAACAGIEFDPLLVATALGQPRMAVLQRLAWIEKTHRLVRGAGRVYAFDHAQIHETLLAALPVLLREEYHGAIGDALAARHGTDMPGAVAAQAARHFLAAGRPDRAAEFGARGLEHLRAAEAYTAAAELATGLLAAPGAFAGAARLALLVKHVRVLGIVGRREAERAAIDESLRLAEELADAPARVQALTSLGWHFIRTARAREAVTVLETAMRGAVEVADPRLEAAAAGHLGMALWDLGRYDEARAALTRQLRIARDLADGAGEAGACGNLGLVEYSIGRYAEAKAHHERHLAWAKATGARRALAVASGNLGIVLLSLGRFEDSLVHVETQLATSREVGDRRGESIALGNLGNLHYARGRWGDALAVIELGLRVSREIGDRVGEASVLVNLGPYAALLGDRERCADALDAGLALSRDIGARYQEGYALFGLGELAETDGDEARAVAHGERALALRREIGHRDGVAESLVALARLRIAAGEHLAARALLEEAASIARELGLAGPQALAAAHAARLPAGDVAACRAAYDACASRMMLRDRMEAAWVLGRAAGDPRIIDDARRAFETALDGAPSERRDAMAWRVPLHRAIAEFTGRTPPSDRTTPAAPYV